MPNLIKYRPTTEVEIRMALHVAIVVNLDKLPQLKGKGKAMPDQREIHIKAFVDAVSGHFRKGLWMTPVEFSKGSPFAHVQKGFAGS